MVTKQQKGNQAEREFEKYLQRGGYDTYRFKPERVCIAPGKWICRQNDGFGLFDIMACNPGDDYCYSPLVFVQVKTHETDYSFMKNKLREWMKNHVKFPLSVCALKIKGRFWKLFRLYYKFDTLTEDELYINMKDNTVVKKSEAMK